MSGEHQPALIPLARDPIVFTVSGVPFAWTRPGVRVASRRIAGKVNYFAVMYTPDEMRAAASAFLHMARPFAPKKPLRGPLRLDVLFVVPIPASWPARDKADAATGRRWPTGKPDRDNFLKLIQDAMNEVFWVDDAQVCAGETTKIYGHDPRTEVRITQLLEE